MVFAFYLWIWIRGHISSICLYFFQGVIMTIFKAIDREGMFVRKSYNQFGEVLDDRYHPVTFVGFPRVTFVIYANETHRCF